MASETCSRSGIGGYTGVHFNSEHDTILWNLEPTWIYTSKAAYRVLTSVGRTKCLNGKLCFTWKCPVPPTVKIFIYLVLNDKILTKNILNRRGMLVNLRCALCFSCQRETTLHLFFCCPYAIAIWRKVSSILQTKIMSIADSIQDWTRSWATVKQGIGMKCKTWATSFVCTVWHIWKQRNMVLFEENETNPNIVADSIRWY